MYELDRVGRTDRTSRVDKTTTMVIRNWLISQLQRFLLLLSLDRPGRTSSLAPTRTIAAKT